VSPRPGGDISNSAEYATMGSGEYRAELERRRSAAALAFDIARQYPGLVIALTYVAVTVVARMQDLWFYRYFRINILNYSSPQDFLLASMRHPGVWLFFLIPGGTLLLASWLLARRRFASLQPPPEMRRSRFAFSWNTPALRLVIGVIVVIAIATTLTARTASQRFTSVTNGIGRHVTFARTDGVTYDEQPLLLGSTGSFFFLFYSKRKVTEIVPVENTALMTVDLDAKKDSGPVIPKGGSTGSTPRLDR
jgi:hypothetical protein